MSIVCTTVNGNLTVCNMLITHGILKMVSNVCRGVNEVREERLRRRSEHDRLRREKLMKKDKEGCKPLPSP